MSNDSNYSYSHAQEQQSDQEGTANISTKSDQRKHSIDLSLDLYKNMFNVLVDENEIHDNGEVIEEESQNTVRIYLNYLDIYRLI